MPSKTNIIKPAAAIFIIAYILNFVWESLHAHFLYECTENVQQYILMMLRASAVDAFLITITFIAITIIFKNNNWIQKPTKKHLTTAVFITLTIAIWIEIRGVYLLNKWSYSALMPTIAGIGISPLAQLPITALITFWAVRKFIQK